MPNSMADVSECGGDQEMMVDENNEGGIRSRDKGGDDCDSDSNSDSTAGLNGEEKGKLPARVEAVGGRYPGKYNFRGSSSEVVFPMKKSEDGDFANLGPDTKDTELRLGLPELGSGKASIPGGRLPDLGILQGGRINPNLPGSQLNAFVPRCSLDFQARANSIQAPDYTSKGEFKLKPMFREFTAPNVQLFPHAPPPAKRIFSETFHGSLGELPKPALNSKFYFPAPWPASLFNLPFPCGQNAWRMPHNHNQTGAAYGQFSGHMGPNEIKRNEVALPVNPPPPPPPANQEGNPEQSQPLTGTPSEQRATRVIGWPPVPSGRRNLASPQPRIAPAAQPNGPPPRPPPPPPVPQPATMFVKVNVDGFPFGRKIDLNAYGSYDELTVGLDEMFRESNPGPFSLRGGDYVLVYEDDEGDRMLVGDVPWRMFVTTVKRLRMIRSSEAPGLGIHRPRPIRGARLDLEREPI